MTDSTRRAVRTVIDVILALLTSAAAVFLVPGFDEAMDKMGFGEVVATWSVMILILVTFFTKLKNALEDANKIPALLKAPASDGANPVPPDAEA